MDFNNYANFLLNNLPFAKPASGRSEVVCKCFYCTDDGDHHHMYISVPKVQGMPSKYNCFKCGAHGWVTYRKLIEWGVYDTDWNMILADYYKSVSSSGYGFNNANSDIANLKNTFIRPGELSDIKLKYINKRLGLNLDYNDLIQNKIVLNIRDVLNENHIKEFSRDIRVIEAIDQYFLGFISYDNSFINCKRLVDGGKLHESVDERYINYNIFSKEDNSKKFYLIPTNINIGSPEPVKVHIAEGPFDALSIKYNLRKEFDHNIYTAIAGNAYKGVMRQLISNIKLINMEVHLYPDSDVKNNVIKDFIAYVRPYKYKVWVHRNLIGKDMGESVDKIKETIERVL